MFNLTHCCRRGWLLCFLLFNLRLGQSLGFSPSGQTYRDVHPIGIRIATRSGIPQVSHGEYLGATRKHTCFRPPLVELRQRSKDTDGSSTPKGFFARLGADDEMFNIKTTISLVGGQAVLVAIAAAIAATTGTPNLGFGPGIDFGFKSISQGLLMTAPLGALAWILDCVEENVPVLQDVTTATQRSVLALLGSTFKPGLGLAVAVSLGLAAGFGEEMLFRGVLQYELISRMGKFGAVGLSSLIFGLLHAVTPMYAFLATLASIYFGYLYLDTGNLAVPIITHAVYDIAALLYAHWTVAKLSPKEQTALAEWVGPAEVADDR